MLNAAVAAAYYLRIVAVMYFRTPVGHAPAPRAARGAWWAAVACAVLVVGVGVYPGPLMRSGSRGGAGARR